MILGGRRPDSPEGVGKEKEEKEDEIRFSSTRSKGIGKGKKREWLSMCFRYYVFGPRLDLRESERE